jgi:protein tyrosine/serine phosphatase
MNLGLIPIRNFGVVSENLYRSAQPMYSYEYQWLKKVLGLQTIINLREELNHDKSMINGLNLGIETITIPVIDHKAPTVEQAEKFMALVRNREPNAPLLFHCEHGHGRTSTFSVLAKMALGQTLEQALEDEKDKFHFEFKHKAQEDWLREFRG